MSILSWIILLFVALGVLQVGIWMFKGVKALYRMSTGRADVITTANSRTIGAQSIVTAPVKERTIFLYGKKLDWNSLPKYCGETGWFGFAKYKDVVVPNKHYYPSVAYMDTTLKQYGYDVMAGLKNASGVTRKNGGSFKAWGPVLAFPVLFSLVLAFRNPPNLVIAITLIWSAVALLALSIVFYFAPAGMRAERRSAERFKHFTKANWQEVYARVGEQMDHEQEVRIAYTRGRMTGWRY